MKQWHPLFASLLQPLMEPHFELRTDVPVGEKPRQADMVLLRRISRGTLPFQGMWRFLTTWNVIEFKGLSVSPRSRDIDRLIELGLGIDRRLNEDRVSQELKRLPRNEISFWYLARHLGRRFLREAQSVLHDIDFIGPGIWRCHQLGRLVFLISGDQVPVEEDSLPLHMLAEEEPNIEAAVAHLIVEKDRLWDLFGGWLATIHPSLFREVRAMAQKVGRRFPIDFRPVVKNVGLSTIIEQIGLDEVIEHVGLDKVIEEVGLDKVIKEVGLDKVIEQVGLDKVIEQVGENALMERLLAKLSPAKRRELKRRLE